MRGVVAAGHPVTAGAGADTLRAGGNAVDAALAAMFMSFVCEPMLTGLGAGGYMLVAPPGAEPVLLDFFVEAPGRGLPPGTEPAPLRSVDVDFGDAVQAFNIGASAAGTYGAVAGTAAAAERFGRLPLGALVAPAVRAARDGVEVNEQQAYLFAILEPITAATEESRALLMPAGVPLRVGDVHRDPALADALERLAAEGPAPFYTGDVAAAVSDWVRDRGGLLTREDLAAYAAVAREPVRIGYRGTTVLTNPPPSAGGILLARALACSTATCRRRRSRPSSRRWRRRRPSGRRSSWPGSPTRASSSGSPRAGSAPPPTSPPPTTTAGRARSRARTARAAARSSPAPAST